MFVWTVSKNKRIKKKVKKMKNKTLKIVGIEAAILMILMILTPAISAIRLDPLPDPDGHGLPHYPHDGGEEPRDEPGTQPVDDDDGIDWIDYEMNPGYGFMRPAPDPKTGRKIWEWLFGD